MLPDITIIKQNPDVKWSKLNDNFSARPSTSNSATCEREKSESFPSPKQVQKVYVIII